MTLPLAPRWLLASLLAPLLLLPPEATARPMRGGGLGGPASGAGVRPGAGWGAPGAGVVRRPGVAAWNPAWEGGRYWQARPWTTGWYRVNPAGWGWWGARAAGWGVSSLATAAMITDQVNDALEQKATVIVVPQTSIQLDYASIQAVAPQGARFAYSLGGGPYAYAQADCKQGLLQGQPPSTLDQAQLLNAVCQIAYGSGV
ncbi:MAG: hypothetical protein ACOVNL_01040 [Prochlorococcaceae cyanobacterium]|jgi:hypothetical protein